MFIGFYASFPQYSKVRHWGRNKVKITTNTARENRDFIVKSFRLEQNIQLIQLIFGTQKIITIVTIRYVLGFATSCNKTKQSSQKPACADITYYLNMNRFYHHTDENRYIKLEPFFMFIFSFFYVKLAAVIYAHTIKRYFLCLCVQPMNFPFQDWLGSVQHENKLYTYV